MSPSHRLALNSVTYAAAKPRSQRDSCDSLRFISFGHRWGVKITPGTLRGSRSTVLRPEAKSETIGGIWGEATAALKYFWLSV